jgi:hypothetical protein
MANVERGELPALVSGSSPLQTVFVESLKGCLLVSSTTYYFMLSDKDAWLASVHVKWDSAFVGVITLESTNLPRYQNDNHNSEVADVTDIDTGRGNWIQQNPSGAYIPVTSTDGSTGGATVSAATVTVAGGTQGGCPYEIAGIGSKRLRLKVVCTAGGYVRVAAHRKS